MPRADDLVQSCLMRALEKQHLWQPGTDLRAWLFTLLHNQRVNDIRRLAREPIVPLEEVDALLTVEASAPASVQLRDLEAAMPRLSEEHRQAVLLAGLEGMGYEQISVVLNIPVGTVRSRLSRGRNDLRRLMGFDDTATNSTRRGRLGPSGIGPIAA